jgi:hypothetical protein
MLECLLEQMEKLARDECSSLSWKFVKDKWSFITLAPGVRQVCWATILLSVSYCIVGCYYWKNPDSNYFRCHNSQHIDIQHNDIQHNYTEHKELICDTQHDWLYCLHITVRKPTCLKLWQGGAWYLARPYIWHWCKMAYLSRIVLYRPQHLALL